jgi:hypothetical protein
MAHMSNRERIARAAEEARLAEAEKADKTTKKTTKTAATPRPKRAPKAPIRMKVVWEICGGTGKVIRTYPYAEKAAAEAETDSLNRSTGNTHVLRPTKVPME